MEVDRDKRRLKLTAERPRSLPRVDYSWYLGGEEVEPASVEGRAFFAGAGGGAAAASYEDGRGLQPKGRGKRALERMQAWQLEGERERRGGGAGGVSGATPEVVFDLDAMHKAAEGEEGEEE